MPAAAALLVLEQSGETSRFASGAAELVLRVQLEGAGCDGALPLSVEAWHRWLTDVLAVPAIFAEFLAQQLGMVLDGAKPVAVGFRLESDRSAAGLGQLIDTRAYPVIPGSHAHQQWLGYFTDSQGGVSPERAAAQALSAVFDYGLHIQDYEPDLDRLVAAGHSRSLSTS
jgi:hypothetical protein